MVSVSKETIFLPHTSFLIFYITFLFFFIHSGASRFFFDFFLYLVASFFLNNAQAIAVQCGFETEFMPKGVEIFGPDVASLYVILGFLFMEIVTYR